MGNKTAQEKISALEQEIARLRRINKALQLKIEDVLKLMAILEQSLEHNSQVYQNAN